MSPILLAYFAMVLINKVFALVVFGMSVWALFEAVRASDYAYVNSYKRTKTFWVAITAACAVFSGLMLFTGFSSFYVQLMAATAAGVFMADVRPAVSVRRRH